MTEDERKVMETEAREFAFFEARLAEYKAKQEQSKGEGENKMNYNPHVDENGNCVNCGTGQLNFDGRSTGCACSRVADAEYEEMQRIIKLLEASCGQQPDCNCEIVISHAIALIKGEQE